MMRETSGHTHFALFTHGHLFEVHLVRPFSTDCSFYRFPTDKERARQDIQKVFAAALKVHATGPTANISLQWDTEPRFVEDDHPGELM